MFNTRKIYKSLQVWRMSLSKASSEHDFQSEFENYVEDLFWKSICGEGKWWYKKMTIWWGNEMIKIWNTKLTEKVLSVELAI